MLNTISFHRWSLPAERDFGWQMKPLDSAKTSFTIDDNGLLILAIEHAIITGVTPKMLFWWCTNIGGEMCQHKISCD